MGAVFSGGGSSSSGSSSVPVVQTTTLVGTQNDLTLTTGVTSLLCNNATLLTLTGLAAGTDGQTIDVISMGAGRVDIANQSASSVAANRVINGVTGTISMVAGIGRARLVYDATATKWRVLMHDQGASILVPFSAANFTSPTGTWVVEAGDQLGFYYFLRGRWLSISVYIATSTITGSPVAVRMTIPGGFTASAAGHQYAGGVITTLDGTTYLASGTALVSLSTTYIDFYRQYYGQGGNSWSAVTNTAAVVGSITFEVQ